MTWNPNPANLPEIDGDAYRVINEDDYNTLAWYVNLLRERGWEILRREPQSSDSQQEAE